MLAKTRPLQDGLDSPVMPKCQKDSRLAITDERVTEWRYWGWRFHVSPRAQVLLAIVAIDRRTFGLLVLLHIHIVLLGWSGGLPVRFWNRCFLVDHLP